MKPKQELHYFTSNFEYKTSPANAKFVLYNLNSLRISSLLALTQFFQNFFFFMICKIGNSHLYLTGLIVFIVLTGASTLLSKKPSPVRSKTSLAFIGLLDIVYFFILVGTCHYINSFVFATQLQATLFIRVFLIKFILAEHFRAVQYLGGLIILVAAILNLAFFGDRYTYLLLLGMVLHCINGIIKRHYLKKFRVEAIGMNRYVLMFATGFGIILIPLLGLVVDEGLVGSLQKEVMCLVGVDCFIMPAILGLLIVSTIGHLLVIKKSTGEKEAHRVIYMFSSVIAFVGFLAAELAVGSESYSYIEIIFVGLAITGSVIYHIYPEVPQKFSYSEA